MKKAWVEELKELANQKPEKLRTYKPSEKLIEQFKTIDSKRLQRGVYDAFYWFFLHADQEELVYKTLTKRMKRIFKLIDQDKVANIDLKSAALIKRYVVEKFNECPVTINQTRSFVHDEYTKEIKERIQCITSGNIVADYRFLSESDMKNIHEKSADLLLLLIDWFLIERDKKKKETLKNDLFVRLFELKVAYSAGNSLLICFFHDGLENLTLTKEQKEKISQLKEECMEQIKNAAYIYTKRLCSGNHYDIKSMKQYLNLLEKEKLKEVYELTMNEQQTRLKIIGGYVEKNTKIKEYKNLLQDLTNVNAMFIENGLTEDECYEV